MGNRTGMVRNIIELGFIALVILILMKWNSCERGKTSVSNSDTVTIILPGDSFPVEIIKPVPTPFVVVMPDSGYIDSVTKVLKSSDSLLRQYVSNCQDEKEYHDSFLLDSNYKVWINYYVRNNELVNRQFLKQRLKGDVIKTVTNEIQRSELWGSISVGPRMVLLSAYWQDKKGYGYGLGYEAVSSTPLVTASIRIYK